MISMTIVHHPLMVGLRVEVGSIVAVCLWVVEHVRRYRGRHQRRWHGKVVIPQGSWRSIWARGSLRGLRRVRGRKLVLKSAQILLSTAKATRLERQRIRVP